MPLRRSHLKSHHGCAQCKQRRIKCDESRPCCGSCTRKNLPCAFRSIGPPSPLHLEFAEIGARSLTLALSERSQLPLLELELLNHWHTATAQSLADAKPLEDILHRIVPGKALANPFLMHSLLAVSALHLSHTSSLECRQKYTEAAMTHHNMSLALGTNELSNVTRENCDALFAFSSLVSVFAFAVQQPRSNTGGNRIGAVIEVFKLIRGVASIVDQGRKWIEEGQMRPLLQVGRFPQSSSRTRQALALQGRLQSLDFGHPRFKNGLAKQAVDTLARSIQHLVDLLQVYLNGEDPRAIMAWPVIIEAGYLDLLDQREPMAFVLLAYYGAALELLSRCWWLEGWGGHLVRLSRTYVDSTADDILFGL